PESLLNPRWCLPPGLVPTNVTLALSPVRGNVWSAPSDSEPHTAMAATTNRARVIECSPGKEGRKSAVGIRADAPPTAREMSVVGAGVCDYHPHRRPLHGIFMTRAGSRLLAVDDLELHLVRDERLLADRGEADLHLPQRPEPAQVGHLPDPVLLVLHHHPDRQPGVRRVQDRRRQGWLFRGSERPRPGVSPVAIRRPDLTAPASRPARRDIAGH